MAADRPHAPPAGIFLLNPDGTVDRYEDWENPVDPMDAGYENVIRMDAWKYCCLHTRRGTRLYIHDAVVANFTHTLNRIAPDSWVLPYMAYFCARLMMEKHGLDDSAPPLIPPAA